VFSHLLAEPLSKDKRNKEIDIVKQIQIALDNGYTRDDKPVEQSNSKIQYNVNTTQETSHKKWTTFTFFNPAIRKEKSPTYLRTHSISTNQYHL
jgi:hypothetical protein